MGGWPILARFLRKGGAAFRCLCVGSFGMNGGDDGTRTRGLCRDRAAF
jgi:hypothetical protein